MCQGPINYDTCVHIQLLQSPIPTTTTPATTTTTSQKASSGDISGTKRGIIDPLVSKRPKKFLIRKFEEEKNVKNGRKWSEMVKMVKMVQNGSKWFQMVQNRSKW